MMTYAILILEMYPPKLLLPNAVLQNHLPNLSLVGPSSRGTNHEKISTKSSQSFGSLTGSQKWWDLFWFPEDHNPCVDRRISLTPLATTASKAVFRPLQGWWIFPICRLSSIPPSEMDTSETSFRVQITYQSWYISTSTRKYVDSEMISPLQIYA